MIDLSTKYIGLNLKNPIIVSSSGLTDSVSKIQKLEQYGAGAVVLKSLFEEQINYEAGQMVSASNSHYPEGEDYLWHYTKDNSVEKYLDLIREAKKHTTLPIIASINCISASDWINFAKRIQEAGADALELNVYVLANDRKMSGSKYEELYFNISAKIKEALSIPFVFKLGPNFTNLVYLTDQLYFRGAAGVVLFNRFYEPDIDLDRMHLKSSEVFSSPSDISKTLRWIGILSAQVNTIDIAASTGVHSGLAAVKMLLAGATAVQVCSVIYKNGMEYVKTIVDELEAWMIANKFTSISQFRGKLNYKNIPDPATYERAQFMKYFSGIH